MTRDEPVSAAQFAAYARVLTRAARRAGVQAPGYRSPPGLVGVDRTIRRRPGAAVVAVRCRGRATMAVLADMVEGVIVAAGLLSPHAHHIRNALWQELTTQLGGVPLRPSDVAPDATHRAA